MRDSLKHIFSNQVVLEDGSVFYYSISPYELRNALGHNIAVLQEFNFAKKVRKAVKILASYTRQKTGIGMTLKIQKPALKKGY